MSGKGATDSAADLRDEGGAGGKGLKIVSEGPKILEIVSSDYFSGCPDVMDTHTTLGATVESLLSNPVVSCCVSIGLCGSKAIGLLLRAVGPIFITVCCTLVASVCWVFINTIYPYHCTPGSLYGTFHIILEAFLFQGLVFNYFMAVSTPPGYAPKLTPEEESRLEEEARRDGMSALNRVCRECKIPKPPRAHHCSVCGTCVMKMDHHCRM